MNALRLLLINVVGVVYVVGVNRLNYRAGTNTISYRQFLFPYIFYEIIYTVVKGIFGYRPKFHEISESVVKGVFPKKYHFRRKRLKKTILPPTPEGGAGQNHFHYYIYSVLSIVV